MTGAGRNQVFAGRIDYYLQIKCLGTLKNEMIFLDFPFRVEKITFSCIFMFFLHYRIMQRKHFKSLKWH